MRNGISIMVSRSDRRRLQVLVADRNAPQKHVWRAEIVLFTADGLGTNEIMRRTAKSKTCVWRWQERFAEEGLDGLLRDKTRPSRIKSLEHDVAERVVALTLTDPPVEATHWTGAMMAKAAGISVSSVQRIWRAHGHLPFHADLVLMAQRRRRVLRQAHEAAIEAGRVPLDRRSPGRHQPFPRRTQCRAETLHLDR